MCVCVCVCVVRVLCVCVVHVCVCCACVCVRNVLSGAMGGHITDPFITLPLSLLKGNDKDDKMFVGLFGLVLHNDKWCMST